jgi:pSer/pThr/pTyr-binding forkhead associated (FHA) protein
MAKLYLKFEQAVLKEVALSHGAVTIGRLPDNTVQIDNLAVSGHHCRIHWENDHYVIEDNNSLNGTYVNNQRVNKATLKDDDQVLIGKHVLLYKEGINVHPEGHVGEGSHSVMPGMEKTMVFTSKNAKAAMDAAGGGSSAAATPARDRVGILTVLEGRTDEKRYVLSSKLSVIGKSDMASIKLKGWFAPKVAANVMRRETKYIIAAADKDVKVQINGEPIAGQHELTEGDTIDVAGFKFQFAFQE